MLITFRTDAAGDVMMFGDVARRMLAIIGKHDEPKGIITVEQLPDAIARLRAAMEADKALGSGPNSEGREKPVGLAQRAQPLLEQFQWALRKEKPVLWGQ